MEIRFAKSNEYKEVLNLVKQVHHQHVAYRCDIFKEIDIPMLQEEYLDLISKNNLLVVVENNNIVGYAQIQFKKTTNSILCKRKILWIDSIAILDQFQHRGYGSHIIQYIKNYAKEQLCDSIELQVNVQNDIALNFYCDNQFLEKEKRMELILNNN